jgi:hypothetical protein
MVGEPGTIDTPTTDQPGVNDTPTTDEPGNNDTLPVDEPGTNDTPTVDEKEFIIVNTKEKKTRTYLNEENEPVTKKEECSQVLFIQCWWQPCQICKKCFFVTLGISETFANHAFKNQQGGVYVGEDRRGKHAPHNKTTKTALDWVRKHIKSFPVVDGHYIRKDSSRKYLGADLNIMRMYQLYVEQCKGKYRERKWSVMLFIGNFSMRSIISHSMSQRKINVHFVSIITEIRIKIH